MTGLRPTRLLPPTVTNRPFLTPPAVQQEPQERNHPPPLPPLVTGLLLVPQRAVDPLDMVVRAHPVARPTLQEGDHLGELLRRQHPDRRRQFGHRQEAA